MATNEHIHRQRSHQGRDTVCVVVSSSITTSVNRTVEAGDESGTAVRHKDADWTSHPTRTNQTCTAPRSASPFLAGTQRNADPIHPSIACRLPCRLSD